MAVSAVNPHRKIIIWKIENFSCWHHIKKSLESPVFVIDNVGEVEWKLILYSPSNKFIGIKLLRQEANRGNITIPTFGADCVILNRNNNPLCLPTKLEIVMEIGTTVNSYICWPNFIDLKMLFEKNEEFLQLDVLTVFCRICEKSADFTTYDPFPLNLQSKIPIEKQCFWWHIKDFSHFTGIPTKSICFEKLFNKDKDSVSIKLSYLVYPEGERIKANVFSKEEIDFSWKCKIVVKATKEVFLLTGDINFKGSGAQSWHFLPAITRKAIIDKDKSDEDYLLQDMLSLQCSFCVISHHIESYFTINSKIPSLWTMELNIPKDEKPDKYKLK